MRAGRGGLAALASPHLGGRSIPSAYRAARRSRLVVSLASALDPWPLWKWLRDPGGRGACSRSSLYCPFAFWELRDLLIDALTDNGEACLSAGPGPSFLLYVGFQPKVSKLSVLHRVFVLNASPSPKMEHAVRSFITNI